MAGLTLYDLTDSYRNLWEMVDGDDTDLAMIDTALKTVEDAIETKAGNIAIFIRNLDSESKLIKEEEERLKSRRQAIENKRDRIKEWLKSNMELAGIDKLKTNTHTISIQNNPSAVQIINEEKIPGKFLTLVPEHYEVRKKDVLDALKQGEEVPGAELSRGRSLRIR
jgi:hypothetical protein